MKHNIYIIVATDEKNGIGKDKDLPWDFKKDLKHFYTITTTTKDPKKEHLLIMGSTTWESIPSKFRPFKKRKNVILHHDPRYKAQGALIAHSIPDAIALADDKTEDIFFIGGGSVYAQAMELPDLTGVYLTKIHKTYDCDTFFPEIPPQKFKSPKKLGSDTENGTEFDYLFYRHN